MPLSSHHTGMWCTWGRNVPEALGPEMSSDLRPPDHALDPRKHELPWLSRRPGPRFLWEGGCPGTGAWAQKRASTQDLVSVSSFPSQTPNTAQVFVSSRRMSACKQDVVYLKQSPFEGKGWFRTGQSFHSSFIVTYHGLRVSNNQLATKDPCSQLTANCIRKKRSKLSHNSLASLHLTNSEWAVNAL